MLPGFPLFFLRIRWREGGSADKNQFLPSKTAISKIESHPRTYYGGYLGPVTSSGFDYFVNLRSLTFDKDSQILFCGGGLTVDSNEDSEWSETEAKSQTMKTILYSSKV